MMFDFQKDITAWALKKGRCAILTGCGTGKSIMLLEWANQVYKREKKNVLIVSPLSVVNQTAREAKKFSVETPVHVCRTQADVKDGINITNYEMAEHFNADSFVAVVLDESSIIKSFTSKTTVEFIRKFHRTPYKLLCTATISPNDFTEIGNSCEFLGIMSRTEMLATYFIHDGGKTSEWRLKKAAVNKFWEWFATWAICFNNPSELGYEIDGYDLPNLNFHTIITKSELNEYEMFVKVAETLQERREARKESVEDRTDKAKEIAESEDSQCLLWVDYNDESTMLHKKIDGSVEVKGSDDPEYKAQASIDFADGKTKYLVSKASIFGFGSNWQSCHREVFCGISDCYDSETEIMVHGGWKHFDELTMEDEVATVNPQTLRMEYQKPTRIINEPYKGKMLHFKNGNGFDLMVTPNHKLFVRKPKERYHQSDDKYVLKYAQDVNNEYKRMCITMLSAPKEYNGEFRPSFVNIDIPDKMRISTRSKLIERIEIKDFIQLVGWYVAEGYCRPLDSKEAGRIVISQTSIHEDYREEIISLMKRIGLHVNDKTKDITGYSYNLAAYLIENFGTGSYNVKLPQWVKDLPKEYLCLLRDTMLKGDGCHDKGRASFYRTASRQLAEDFYEICIKTGLRVAIKERQTSKRSDIGKCYDVTIAWKSTEPYMTSKAEEIDYEGMIGCVTVPNHVVIVRRNGKHIVSGNSYERFYQAVRRCWRFGQTHEVDVYIILSEKEVSILENIKKKQAQMDEMQHQMTSMMKEVTLAEIQHTTRITTPYEEIDITVPDWLKGA